MIIIGLEVNTKIILKKHYNALLLKNIFTCTLRDTADVKELNAFPKDISNCHTLLSYIKYAPLLDRLMWNIHFQSIRHKLSNNRKLFKFKIIYEHMHIKCMNICKQ